MKSLIFLSQTLRQVALVTLLMVPFTLVPCNAKELVGQPADVKSVQASSAAISSSLGSVDNANHAGDSGAPEVSTAYSDDDKQDVKELKEVLDHVGPALNDVFEHHGDEIKAAVLIPIFAITFGVGGPILLVIILVMLHYRAKDRRQQNINANIEKLIAAGRDVPMELLVGEDMRYTKTSTTGDEKMYARDDVMLYKGVRNIGLGIGLFLFLTFLCGFGVGSVGFILIGLGLSRLIIWKVTTSRMNTVARVDTVKAQD